MHLTSPDRLRLGVSACLLGEPVRYDGGQKRHDVVCDRLGPTVEWVPVCPEAEAGLGVPREPIQLEDDLDSPRVRSVQSRRDVTDLLGGWAEKRLDTLDLPRLDGFVLKARSPSCEPRRGEVFRGKVVLGHAPGLFAARLGERDPLLPTCHEEDLETPALRRHFLECAWGRQRARGDGETSAWIESHRLLLLAREQELPDPGKLSAAEVREELLKRMTVPSTSRGHAQALRWGLHQLEGIDEGSRIALAIFAQEVEIERLDPEVGRQLLRALSLRDGSPQLLAQHYLQPLPARCPHTPAPPANEGTT